MTDQDVAAPPGTYLTDEVRAFVGRAGRPSAPFRVDAWGARRFAEATGDPNPRYGAGGPAEWAPPTLLGQNIPDLERPDPPLEVPHPTGLVGSLGWEFVRPLRVGETVVAQMRVTSIVEKQGRLGTMVFLDYETTFTDAGGDTVAVFRLTRIRY
ncbi:MAG TPA: MaoC family dehydratase N-terminal domain-containing protein [Mycobacteriales bacterium]|nr:MaoC family dehydratase N-terminal domain-containing protein [Mycobacteriales bacterium]